MPSKSPRMPSLKEAFLYFANSNKQTELLRTERNRTELTSSTMTNSLAVNAGGNASVSISNPLSQAFKATFTLPNPKHFINRKELLDNLVCKLISSNSDSENVISIWGPIGSGKSSLAIKGAYECINKFAENHWIDFSNNKTLIEATGSLKGFLLSIGLDNIQQLSGEFEVLSNILRSTFKQKDKSLLILDNIDCFLPSHQLYLEKLFLPPPSITLVTSNIRFHHIHDLYVGELDEIDSLEIFRSYGLHPDLEKTETNEILKKTHKTPTLIHNLSKQMVEKHLTFRELLLSLQNKGATS